MLRSIFLFALIFSVVANAEEPPVEIGLLASLTGNWSAIGRNLQEGASLAIEEANQRATATGFRFQLNVQDTDEEKSGAKVVSSYRFLLGKGVRFFIGPTGVPGILALTPLAVKDDILLIAPTSTNSFYKDSPKLFNASGDNYVTTKAIAQRAYSRGFRKLAIFGSLQPWESDQAQIFKREFISLGGTIVSEQYPAADQTDLRNEALRIIRSKPDAVFFALFNNVAIAAKALLRHGFSGGTFASIMDDAHIAASNGALDGTELYLFNPPSPAFIDRFTKRFGRSPGVFADSAYDAALSLATAIQQTKSIEPAVVGATLLRLNFIGSAGISVSFDPDGLISRGITLRRIIRGTLE